LFLNFTKGVYIQVSYCKSQDLLLCVRQSAYYEMCEFVSCYHVSRVEFEVTASQTDVRKHSLHSMAD